MQEDPKGGGRRRDGRRGRDGATKTKTRETRLTDGRRAIGAEGQGRGHDLGGLKGGGADAALHEGGETVRLPKRRRSLCQAGLLDKEDEIRAGQGAGRVG